VQLGIPERIGVTGPGDMAFSSDGNQLFVNDVHGIQVLDAHTHQVIRMLKSGGNLHPSPDGRLLYAVGHSQVDIIDLATGQVSATVPLTHPSFGMSSAISQDGRRIVTFSPISNPLVLTIVDIATRTKRADLVLNGFSAMGDVQLSRDGSYAYLAADDGPLVRVNLDTGQQSPVPATPGVSRLALSRDGRELFAQSFAGLLTTINADTGEVIRRVTMPPTSGKLLAAPGGQLIATNFETQRLQIIDPGTGTVLTTVSTGQHSDCAVVSPDGRQLYLTGNIDNIEQIDMAEH